MSQSVDKTFYVMQGYVYRRLSTIATEVGRTIGCNRYNNSRYTKEEAERRLKSMVISEFHKQDDGEYTIAYFTALEAISKGLIFRTHYRLRRFLGITTKRDGRKVEPNVFYRIRTTINGQDFIAYGAQGKYRTRVGAMRTAQREKDRLQSMNSCRSAHDQLQFEVAVEQFSALPVQVFKI